MSTKAEDQGAQNTQSQTSTPTQTYSTTQWAASQIPIDPQLQQQSQHATTSAYYQAYTSHYPQAAYATHYQQYMASQQTAAITRTTSSTPVAQLQAQSQSQNVAPDTTDIANLKDALGSAGVDLRAEEESLQRSHDQHQSYRPYEDRTRKQPPKPTFDTRVLGATMRTIGTQHKITRIPEDSVNYLALALRARLQDLVTAMIAASHHRTDTQFDRPASLYDDGSPMWSIVVRSDVAKQLAALEKIEREEETKVRRERKERSEMAATHAAALAAQANGSTGNGMAVDSNGGEDADGTKKKKKKDGPGVTARNMSEDVRKKMSNATATRAAGLGGKYAWMAAASSATPTPKSKGGATASATAAAGVPTPATTTTPANKNSGAGGSWARPYVPSKRETSATPAQSGPEEDTRTVVTMRDAMFVVEKERGHGGGRGAARGRV